MRPFCAQTADGGRGWPEEMESATQAWHKRPNRFGPPRLRRPGYNGNAALSGTSGSSPTVQAQGRQATRAGRPRVARTSVGGAG